LINAAVITMFQGVVQNNNVVEVTSMMNEVAGSDDILATNGIGGGFLIMNNSIVHLASTIITLNTISFTHGSGAGGAVVGHSVLSMNTTQVTFNTAMSTGGGLYVSDSSCQLQNSFFYSNYATSSCSCTFPGAGGGVYLTKGSYLTSLLCQFENNYGNKVSCKCGTGPPTTYGGGLYIASGSSAQMIRCNISSNVATYGFGGKTSPLSFADLMEIALEQAQLILRSRQGAVD